MMENNFMVENCTSLPVETLLNIGHVMEACCPDLS